MAEWRRCLRHLPAQLRRAKKGTPAALKSKGRDENRALCICVPMIGGRRRSFASVYISSPLDAERQGEDLRRIVRVVVVRQAMTTLIDGKGFTDDAGKTLFSYAHRSSNGTRAARHSAVPFYPWRRGPHEPSGTIFSDFHLFRFAKTRSACPLCPNSCQNVAVPRMTLSAVTCPL